MSTSNGKPTSKGKPDQPQISPEHRAGYSTLSDKTRVALERSRALSAGVVPNPQYVPPAGVPACEPDAAARPLRRTFTQQYKDSILTQAAQCTQPGQVGALLRREGLYSSHLVDWRRQQERQQAKAAGQTPPPVALAVQNKALRAKTKQLEKQLAQAQALLDLQKKVSQLLGITLETLEISEENS